MARLQVSGVRFQFELQRRAGLSARRVKIIAKF